MKNKSTSIGKNIHYQWFPVYGFDMNLNVNETTRFQTCKMKMLEIKWIYCHFHVTNVTDSSFPTLSQILYKKWRGIMLYPPKILKFWVSVRPSIHPSVCLSVRPSALRFRTLTWVAFNRFSTNFAWTLISRRSGLGLQMG